MMAMTVSSRAFVDGSCLPPAGGPDDRDVGGQGALRWGSAFSAGAALGWGPAPPMRFIIASGALSPSGGAFGSWGLIAGRAVAGNLLPTGDGPCPGPVGGQRDAENPPPVA